MKKIILVLFIFCSFFAIFSKNNVYAADETPETKVEVLTKIPWANCEKIAPETKYYTCTIKWWMGWFQTIVSGLIKYITMLWAI